MQLSIVIVNYNNEDLVKQCLESIYKRKGEVVFEVIVIDNASGKDSLGKIQNKFPTVNILRNDKNLGFAKACNQGARLSRGEFILFLNPDIIVLDGALDEIVKFMTKHPEAGLGGGWLQYPDGAVQYSCRRFYRVSTILFRRTLLKYWFGRSSVIREYLMMDWDHKTCRPVDWVVGACMIARRSLFEKIGLFDERFFMYFEDVDLCYRVWQKGGSVYYVPQARFIHLHQRESARGILSPAVRAHLKSLWRFCLKHKGLRRPLKEIC